MDAISKTVPEFLYDLLARIIPGAFLVGPMFVAYHDSIEKMGALGFGTVSLICAYVLGFVVELLSARWLEWPYNRRNCKFRGYTPSEDTKDSHFFQKRAPTDLCLWPHEKVMTSSSRYFKMLAELGMFRSLLFVCLIHTVLLSVPSCYLPTWLWYYKASPVSAWFPLFGAALCAYSFDTVHLIITGFWSGTGKTRL